jgi:hypothetical protein
MQPASASGPSGWYVRSTVSADMPSCTAGAAGAPRHMRTREGVCEAQAGSCAQLRSSQNGGRRTSHDCSVMGPATLEPSVCHARGRQPCLEVPQHDESQHARGLGGAAAKQAPATRPARDVMCLSSTPGRKEAATSPQLTKHEARRLWENREARRAAQHCLAAPHDRLLAARLPRCRDQLIQLSVDLRRAAKRSVDGGGVLVVA